MQRAKKRKAGARSDGTPRKAGASPLPGKGRAKADGGEQAATGAGTGDGIGFHLLGSQLRTYPLIEIALLTGDTGHRPPGLVAMVDTESKQLQAIEDLYAIVKAQPKYANLREPAWKPETAPMEVLSWLLRKLGPLAKGNEWTVDTWKDGKKTRYRFVVIREFHRQKVPHRDVNLPLDFLPWLKRRDLPLHDLIIDVIALVNKCNKVPLWDEDGDFSEPLQSLLEDRYLATELYPDHFSTYTGVADHYLQEIRSRQNEVTIGSVAKRLSKYDASSQRKRQMQWWLENGLALARTGQCVTEFSYIPNYRPGSPVTPYRQYKFIWSLHKLDFLRTKAVQHLQKDAEDGDFYPVEFTITYPGEEMKPFAESETYPELLYAFLDLGGSLLLSQHRRYYYKDMLDDPLTPSIQLQWIRPRTLVDILNTTAEVEIENQIQIRV